jgi:Cu(I)/Ag(I) efflux system membrane fusion protein
MNIQRSSFLRWGVLAAALLTAGGYGLYRLGAARVSDHPAAPNTTSPAAKKILYWRDPMVPATHFDKPGKSPFMDMQLEPVYAENNADQTGGVAISARAEQNLGVRTTLVERGTLAPTLNAVGNVAWNERDVAVVPARATGYVEKLYVRAQFDPIKPGQPLAQLYVPDWIAAQEELLAVRRMQADGLGVPALLDGARQRMRLVGMTPAQIAAVEARGRVEPRITISAPIGGVIAELGAREGLAVTLGMPLFRINGLSTVWVNAQVLESQAELVRPGNPVEVRAAALGSESIRGKVGAVLPDIDPVTRTLRVRIELPNPGYKLVPGMFASVHIMPPQRRADATSQPLLIPSEALIVTGQRKLVMVAQAQGRFMPVEVETGLEANGQVEIRKGLQAGQRVVLSGQFLLDSEASLKGVEARHAGDGSDATSYRGEGRVEALGNGTVTLSHDPIAALQWPAMTMEFASPPGGVPRNIAAGDRVTFSFRKTDSGSPQLLSITPEADAPIKAAP